jgi:hypothetical protein
MPADLIAKKIGRSDAAKLDEQLCELEIEVNCAISGALISISLL